MLTTDYSRLTLPYRPQPRQPRTWQGQRLYCATVAGVTITVHAPDKGEALLKIMAIALEYNLKRL